MKQPLPLITFLFIAFGAFFLKPAIALPKPERLIADRPGFSTGTHAVTPGTFYLETGYQYNFAKKSTDYSEIPMMNLRMGIINRLELFVGWDGWEVSHKRLENTDISLPLIGVKYSLLEFNALSFTAMTTISTSHKDNGFTADPALALLWDFKISDWWEVFGLLQAGCEDNSFNPRWAIGLGYAINETIELVTEYYIIAYPSPGFFHQGTEVGILIFMSKNVQLDIYGGYGFHKELNSYAGLGFSQRF